MANKRQLKKFITNTCGSLAAEIVLARAAFPSIKRESVHDIVVEIARLQSDCLGKVSISFDKTPRDFENKALYRRARSAYFNTAYTKLLESFDTAVLDILKNMNAALPQDVRDQIKVAAAE